jgi:hypothetical protein
MCTMFAGFEDRSDLLVAILDTTDLITSVTHMCVGPLGLD